LLTTAVLCASVAHSEEPVRGEFPHAAVDLGALLETRVAPGDAEQMFIELRTLLLNRMGSDIITEDQLYLGAMQGMLVAIDEQLRKQESPAKASLPSAGMLLRKEQAEPLYEDLAGRMTGIGIEFELYAKPGVLVVSRVLPDSPAERSGVLEGDRIIAINDQGFRARPLTDVLSLLQGEAGTTLQLGLVRMAAGTAQRYSVRIERQRFDVRSVEDLMQANGVGYIRIARFHQQTPTEVEDSVRHLEKLGADRLIIDLRNNSGGDLMAALEVADLFVPPSTVLLRVIEPGLGAQDVVASRPCLSTSPMVILVNRWTLGSAESVAASLQEHGRAYVIGETTMGSARTQTLLSLGSSLMLRLESVRLETATGKSWQAKGLQPDLSIWGVSVPLSNPLAGREPVASDLLFETARQYLEAQP